MLANIDFARGSTESAKKNLLAAIDANPQNLTNYMTLVTQYEKEKNWDAAKELCERAHQADPTSPYPAAELAFLYLEHGGDVNVAVSLAQMVKQKMPGSPVASDVLGWSYYKLGSLDSAIAELKESARKPPGIPSINITWGWLTLRLASMTWQANLCGWRCRRARISWRLQTSGRH